MKSKSCKILLKGKTHKYIFTTRGNKFRRYALIKPIRYITKYKINKTIL